MKRRRRSLVLFGAFAALLIGAMSVVTGMLLRLEQRESEARREAELQQRIGLALWRMESTFAPLLARESARPYFHYVSHFSASQSFNRMLQPAAPGETLIASPLLTANPEFCALHVQIDADGSMESPRVPAAAQRAQALRDGLSESALHEAIERLERFRRIADRDALLAAARRSAEMSLAFRNESAQRERSLAGSGRSLTQESGQAVSAAANAAAPQRWDADQAGAGSASARRNENPPVPVPSQTWQQQESNAPQKAAKIEFQKRADAVDNTRNIYADDLAQSVAALDAGCTLISQGVFVPTWLYPDREEPQLVLVRPVTLQLRNVVQCIWIDWPGLRAALEERVRDLLPTARLVPISHESDPDCNALASIPAALRIPPDAGAATAGLSPTRLTLLVAWIGLLGGIGAVGFVVHALAELGDRRGRFVSAVTHELRTPLTTFCLYTQMLDDGMVREDTAQREYISTLRRESERLTRIVENVLWYARLTDLRGAARIERIDAAEALERILPALERRAGDGAMRLEIDIAAARGRWIEADVQSLERVLMNLIDNACKYVGATADRRVHVEASAHDGALSIRVSDHGPGIPLKDVQRVFEPFERSETVADPGRSTTQGVGLGLALSRGLMREMGGDLRLESRGGYGASFVLTLPIRSTA